MPRLATVLLIALAGAAAAVASARAFGQAPSVHLAAAGDPETRSAWVPKR